jgi:chromosome partitioning protein
VSLGVDPGGLSRTIYHVLVEGEREDGTGLLDIIVPTTVPDLLLAPSSIDLAAAELELAARIGRENALRKRMGPVLDQYGYIIVDTPPSLGLLTLNSLVAADGIIIPIQTHYYALLGMRQLLRTLKMVREEVGHDVEILGVLPTMYDSRTNISKEIVQGIKDFFGDKVYSTTIHRTAGARRSTNPPRAPGAGSTSPWPRSSLPHRPSLTGRSCAWSATPPRKRLPGRLWTR